MENKLLVLGALALLAGSLYLATNTVVETVAEPEVVPADVVKAFEAYQTNYGKRYSSLTKSYRLQVYYANYQKIEAHNANKQATYTMGENQFMDITEEEFKNTYLMTVDEVPQLTAEAPLLPEPSNDSWDWLAKGVVTSIKNQGRCGSCWAFSTVGALESHLIHTQGQPQSLDLSEQQLVDCTNDGSHACHGCSGGWPYEALRWTRDNGVVTETQYPYNARDGTCSNHSGPFKNSDFVKVQKGKSQLRAALQRTPVSVCVDATNFQHYTTGIFTDCTQKINHAVLLVGYTDQYWVIKNSWGEGWGDKGLIKVTAATDNACGIEAYAVYPV